MDIFLEALNIYKEHINVKGERISSNGCITDEKKEELLIPILTSYEKILALIDEIKLVISMNITALTVKKRNDYFRNHELSKDDLTEIKIIMRRIKNRYYQQDSRYKKDIINK